MPVFKNVSPRGDLDFPLVGRIVAAGEEFEVTDEQAKNPTFQTENFELVKKAAPAKKGDDTK